MTIENEIFKKASVDFDRVKKYGFKKAGGLWEIEKTFMEGAFRCTVKIDDNGRVFGIVYDNENGEEFLPLRAEGFGGGFVSKVKEEYEKILKEVLKNCFSENYFISPQANRINALICEKYSIEPDFPWKGQKTASDAGVYRKTKGGKWFALLMNIKKDRLVKGAKGEIEIINLKLDEDEIQTLIKKEGFYPAYHMNKKSWITLSLDDTLSDKTVLQYIEKSYNNVK